MYEFKSRNQDSKDTSIQDRSGLVERAMRSIVVAAGLIALGVALGFC